MKKLFLSFAAVALVASVYSCRDTKTEEANDAMEQAADDMGDAMDETGDAVENAAEDTGDAIDNGAQEVKEEVNGTDDNQ